MSKNPYPEMSRDVETFAVVNESRERPDMESGEWRLATEADAYAFNAYPSLRERYEIRMENLEDPLAGEIFYRTRPAKELNSK